MSYMQLKQGEIDPNLNMKIRVLILQSKEFIVYLDESLETQYHGALQTWPLHFGAVASRVSKLESLSSFIKDEKRLELIRTQIAQALAICLDGSTAGESESALDSAEIEITLRNRETSRVWFFLSALFCALLFLTPALWLLLSQPSCITAGIRDVLATSLLGALGALASVCIRNDALKLDANAGIWLHIIESAARIVIGVIASLLLILMVKGGLVFSFIGTAQNAFALLCAFGIIAGASERALPSLIKRGEEIALDSSGQTRV